MLPLRGLRKAFDSLKARLALRLVAFLQPRIRAWARNYTLCLKPKWRSKSSVPAFAEEFTIDSPEGKGREHFLALLLHHGWTPAGDTDTWDVEKSATRVLMATERGDGIARRTLVRVWGSDVAAMEAKNIGAPL